MLMMVHMAERYPFEMPRALSDAGYYTFGHRQVPLSPAAQPARLHQLLLDESGRAEMPGFRSDYRAWFWSQAPISTRTRPASAGTTTGQALRAPERLHPTRWTAQTAVNFIEGYSRREPFFLKVSFARPHSPYDPPERFWKRYEDADMPPARVGKWAAKYAPRSSDRRRHLARRPRRGAGAPVAAGLLRLGQLHRRADRPHSGSLEKRKLLDDTLIVFTADHGDMTGDHNLWRKSYAYEPSARIPMLMRWPTGLVSGKRGQVLRAAGGAARRPADVPGRRRRARAAELDGRSMLALARGKTAGWREYLDLEHDVCYAGTNHWNALTDGRGKYIYHAFDGAEQLFDLRERPARTERPGGRLPRPRTAAQWRERMITHLARAARSTSRTASWCRARRISHFAQLPRLQLPSGEETGVGFAKNMAASQPGTT